MKWHLEQGEANGGSSAKSFTWTTVQLNYNTECDCHVDANNMGSSKIIGLGNYSGGELWMYDAKGNVYVEVMRPVRGAPWAKVGLSH